MRILSVRSDQIAGPSYPDASVRGDQRARGPVRFGGMAVRELALSQSQYAALFAAAEQFISSLRGRLVKGAMPLLSTGDSRVTPSAIALGLHDHWRLAHPEAGPAYWLTRSWGMLCWQSIYLAMVAVYRVGAMPALDKLGQGYGAGLVSGFSLPIEPMIEGAREVLISAAGKRLRLHWQALFELMAGGQRLRPGFIRPLLADDLLAALVRVPDFFPEVSREQIAAHAPLWLAACGLPAEHLAGWRQSAGLTDGVEAAPGYVRQRCCLHHKRSDGALCDNCPRRHGGPRCGDGAEQE